MDVLLTNDDGYNCVGFYPLLEELSKEFKVLAAAPAIQKSWVGKSINAHTEFEIKEEKIGNFNVYAVNGTPADCVQVALYHLLKNAPKIVISGINMGENIGHGRILSSGTVGAAMEAAIDGIKAISTSLYIPPNIKNRTDFYDPKNYVMFRNAAQITLKIAKIVMDSNLNSNIDLVSINIPFNATVDSPFEITRPFKEPYGQLFSKQKNKFIHTQPILEFTNLKDGTDLKALHEGKISITPISLDLVSKESVKDLREMVKNKW
jgi:5'-nucleotidase